MPEVDDWEQERRKRLDELIRDEPDVPERFAPDTFGMHELLDRAHLASSFFQEHVLEHPACVLSEDLWREAGLVAEALANFYQKVGAATALEGEDDQADGLA